MVIVVSKKGFSLVELLATIVVIAIISLIAVPVVTGIIERSRKASFLRSAENVNKISKNYYIENSEKFSNKDEINFNCNNKECTSEDLDAKNSNLGAEGSMGEGYVKIYDNGNVEFLLSNGKYCVEKNPNKEEVKIYNNGTCEGIVIDNDKIKINSIKTISTTNSIIVYGDVTAGKSGVSRYEFYIDNKLDGTVETTNTSYTHPYTKVSGKNHKIKVKVYNGTYGKPNYDESIGMDEKEIDASLSDFGTITIKPSTTEWASSKTYTISGTTDGAILQYKVVSGTTVKQDWTNYSNAITVDWISTKETPTHIYARFYDGYNTSNGANLDETKIDTTVPSAPTVIKGVYTDWTVIDDLTKYHNKTVYFPQVGKNGEELVSGAIDNESGIARYEISSDNKTWYDLSKYNATGVYSTTTSTTRYYRAVNNVGLSSEATKVDIKIDTTNPTVSYSLAGGTYNAYQTVRVTPSDENYSSMAVHVYKNSALVYSGKVDAKSTNSTSASYYDVALDSDGAWTIYTQVFDQTGNKQNQNPDNGGGWYYQTYIIDTIPPTITYNYNAQSVVDWYGGAYYMGCFNGGITPTLTLADTGGSGLSRNNQILVWKDDTWPNNAVSIGNNQWNIPMAEEGRYIPHIYVTDNAGNESVGTRVSTGDKSHLTVWEIDTSTPTMSVNFNGYTPGTWTNGNVAISLSGSNSGCDTTKNYYYSINDGNWVHFGTGDTATYNITSDSNYNIKFLVTDVWGRWGTQTQNYSIKRDATAPTYTNYEIKNVTSSGYDVYVYGVSDAGSGVNRVQFPTWTTNNGQDDIQSNWQTNSSASGKNQGNGTWYYRVNVSDHNNESGTYNTHIYLYDNLGNVSGITTTGANVPSAIPKLIINKNNTTPITMNVSVNGSNVYNKTVSGADSTELSIIPNQKVVVSFSSTKLASCGPYNTWSVLSFPTDVTISNVKYSVNSSSYTYTFTMPNSNVNMEYSVNEACKG